MNAKDAALNALGCGPDDAPPKQPPPKPRGAEKKAFAAVMVLGTLALLGYFLYLVIQIITEFDTNTKNPPLKIDQSRPPVSSGDPRLFPFALCSTGYGKRIDLLQMSYQQRSNESVGWFCYPQPGDSGQPTPCNDNYRAGDAAVWKVTMRSPPPDPLEFRRRRRLGEYETNGQPTLMPTFAPNGLIPGDGGNGFQYLGGGDTNCLVFDPSRLAGFGSRFKRAVRRDLTVFFKFEQVPDDPNKVVTLGLDGIDMYIFDKPEDLPGYAAQSRTGNSPFNFTGRPIIVKPETFMSKAQDALVIGSNTMYKLGFEKTTTTYLSGKVENDYSLSTALQAAIEKTQYQKMLQNEPLNATDVNYASVTIFYSTPVVTTFTETQPQFGVLLGAIGGLFGLVQSGRGAITNVLAQVHLVVLKVVGRGAAGSSAAAALDGKVVASAA